MLNRAMMTVSVALLAALANLPRASAGIVTGTATPIPATTPLPTVNLATLGTDDWAVWAYGASGSVTGAPSASKAGAGLISDATTVGATGLRGVGGMSQTFTYASATNVRVNGITCSTLNTAGDGAAFTLTGQAGYAYTLYVFVGGYNGMGNLTASIGESSLYTDNSITYDLANNPKKGALYTLVFTPQEANSVLTVSYTVTPVAGGSSHVFLEAAAVSSAPVPEAASLGLICIGAAALLRRKL